MKNRDLLRYVLGGFVTAAMLAGCGGPQPPIGGTGAIPTTIRSRGVTLHPERGGSWMLPEARRRSLIYAALPYEGVVNVYTFPGGRLVGQISDDALPHSICADKPGNIWISDSVSDYSAHLNEYAHGGTMPFATLDDQGGSPAACAVDPLTGNLAVANACYSCNFNDVEIYAGARGSPELYYPKDIYDLNAIAYDSMSDLFLSGRLDVYAAGSDWLRSGGPGFRVFKTKHPHTYPHEGLFWDGKDLTEVAHPDLINRYAILDGKAKYVGSMTLRINQAWAFALEKSNLAVASNGPTGSTGTVYIFKYPAGGDPIHTINLPGLPGQIAISEAPPMTVHGRQPK